MSLDGGTSSVKTVRLSVPPAMGKAEGHLEVTRRIET